MADEVSVSTAASAPRSTATTAARGAAFSPRFIAVLVLLVGTAVTFQVLADQWQVWLRKDPVPLKKPLEALDYRRLEPLYGKHVLLPERLSHEVEESLGTTEYINARFVDRSVDRDDPVSVANVFVSYYTGNPDAVPHVPDECISASGAVLKSEGTAEVRVPKVDAPDDEIGLRVLEFEQPSTSPLAAISGGGARFTVMYFFYVNGKYCQTRNEVRNAQYNLTDRYAFYSKIEIRFTDYEGRRSAGREESIQAAERLLRVLLPVLREDHYADWDKLKAESQAARRQG